MGEPLLERVRRADEALAGLLEHREELGDAAAALEAARADVHRRLTRRELHVAVVGEQKAGKSTFLNAIAGYPLLGTAVREYTGTVTGLRWGAAPEWVAWMEDGTVRRSGDAEPGPPGPPPAEEASRPSLWRRILAVVLGWLRRPRIEDPRPAFAAEIAWLTDVAGSGRAVARLDVAWPCAHLPPDIVLLDTPGVNTADEANRTRAWAAIRDEADACVVISDITQAVSMTTRALVRGVREIVPHVILVLTKLDRALENARVDDPDDAEAAVTLARRVATRRFAEAIGRPPDELLALAVAAEPALRGEGAFAADVATLVVFLREERALVVAARCAAALATAARGLSERVASAEAVGRARLAALEAVRIPDPGAFVAALPPLGVRESAIDALEGLRETLHRELGLLTGRAEITAWSRDLGASLGERVPAALSIATAEAMADAEGAVLGALRERYRIAEVLSGCPGALEPAGLESPVPALDAALRGHAEVSVAFGVGGAAAGAVLGTLVLPGIGTLIGAALGSFARLLVTADDLRRDCRASLDAWFTAVIPGLADEAAVRAAARLGARLDIELGRFGGWIDAVIAREQEMFEAEHRRLDALRAAVARAGAALAALEEARGQPSPPGRK